MRQKQPLPADATAQVTQWTTEEVVPEKPKAEQKSTVKPTQKGNVYKSPSGNTIEDF